MFTTLVSALLPMRTKQDRAQHRQGKGYWPWRSDCLKPFDMVMETQWLWSMHLGILWRFPWSFASLRMCALCITLHRQHWRVLQKLHDSLITYFKGKLGEDLVRTHKYNISTKDGKWIVQANDWGSFVKNGTELVMSMIVEKVALGEGKARAQRNTCPYCYKTDLGVMADEGWFQW